MIEWNALAGIAAALAVCVAVWAVIVAHRANGRARESNGIAEQSLKVAKQSHELNERLAPPEWSLAEQFRENAARFRNQSGRHIVVTSLTTIPEEASADMSSATRPHRVENGDAFAVGFEFTMASVQPEKLVIGWHFEDSPEDQRVTERAL